MNFISGNFMPDINVMLYECSILLIQKALFIINKLNSDLLNNQNTLQLKNFNEFLTSKHKKEIQSLFSQQKTENTQFLARVGLLIF